ncbi:hypothetical protein ACJMK2_028650 [Sinanodonta woodiana]|uniref:Amino acid transporter transmembrane domain-containing protein n=1 Tax=Sinanodonta woodiana TaxID=1069815 RepID=A0ABD3XA07_SINWO
MEDTDRLVVNIASFQKEKVHGLTIWTCAVFIVGEIAGSGVLALPKAVDNTGWIGVVLVIGCCFLSAYTGDILGRAWGIVRERHERYRTGHVRYPYPAMGEITYGKFGRLLVSFSINFTLFGVACVFLLIASENIQSLLSDAGVNISFCYWSIVIAGVLTPLTWLGTPSDFWFVAVGATCATAVACVILVANMIKDKPNHPTVEHSNPDFLSFFTAFGVICFAFGGHPAFPTFQTDMRNQKHFGRAVLVGYLIVLAMYLPVSLGGYFVYGELVQDNVLNVVSNGYLKYIVQILITVHLLLGFIIVINPFCQELEHLIKIPETFTYKRIISRTAMVICVLFVAETVPHFGAILSLVGGSTTTLLAYVCPSLFYLKLCKMKPTEPGENWEPIEVPFHVKVLNYEIILLGICAGAASTVSAINSLVSSSFSTPCYIDVNRAA